MGEDTGRRRGIFRIDTIYFDSFVLEVGSALGSRLVNVDHPQDCHSKGTKGEKEGEWHVLVA